MNGRYLQTICRISIGSLHYLPHCLRCNIPKPQPTTICSNLFNIHSMILLCIERLTRPFLNMPPNLGILVSINLRSGQLRRQLISADNNRRVSLEEAIDIFQRAVGSLWIEEIGDRDECEADAGLSIHIVVSFGKGRVAGSVVQVGEFYAPR
jgi:hypothetical protein